MTHDNLPTFESPPVGEVVLSVQFQRLAALQAAHLGQFWERIRADFPRTETHPPVDAVVERFNEERTAARVRFQFRPIDPLPRAWFISTDDTRLIQVQADRFIVNWRRSSSGQTYPRFPQVKSFFARYWSEWKDFISTIGQSGSLEVEQCEITYTNHIRREGVWNDHGEAYKVLRLVAPAPELSGNIRSEFTSFSSHYVIENRGSNNASQPIGRLHIDLDPGVDAKSGDPIFILNLLVRGMPPVQTPDVLDFFSLGRELIVANFKNITTDEMHRVWKLQEER